MAVIVPADKSVESFEGIHLYHGDISNCSMRVRMTLIEKDLPWTSHHLDLKLKENVSDEYFGINPNGLVPTLIDNGVVHIESNDIIDYLDKAYPEPPLRAAGDEGGMLEWLRLAASIHLPAVKPYVYATRMQKKLKKTAEEQEKYDKLQKNEDLKKFHARHAGGSELGEKDIARASRDPRRVFHQARKHAGGARMDYGRPLHPGRYFVDPPAFRARWVRLSVRELPEHRALGGSVRAQGKLQGRYPEMVPGFRESLNGRSAGGAADRR